jgi:hypothetical protein
MSARNLLKSLASWTIAGLFVCTLAACAGSDADIPAAETVPLPLELIPPFPQELLPALTRHTDVLTDFTVDGSSTFAVFGSATPNGTSLELSPPAAVIAAAIYRFDLAGNPLMGIDVNLSSSGNAYYGIANFDTLTWQIEGPFTSNPPALELSAGNYTSPGDFLYFFVLAFDGAQVTHSNSVVTTDVTGGGPPWTISGQVLDGSAQPMPDVVIHVAFQNLSATTDVDGNFQLTGLNNGDYILVPDAASHATATESLAFEPNIVPLSVFDQNVQQDFVATPVSMPATVTYASHMRPWLFEPVCMNCHSSTLSGLDRHGAPLSVNWDTYDGTTELSKTSGNTRVQMGTMPAAALTFTTNDYQKALFQKWLDGGFQP